MAVRVVFKCGNPKCHATVDADLLNRVRLKIIRRVALLCEHCKTRTMWLETSVLIDVEQIKQMPKTNGGQKRATNINTTH